MDKELAKDATSEAMTTWRELCPEGRQIFYEGDNPEAFVKEIKECFGFDPSQSDKYPDGSPFNKLTWADDRCFWCPPEYLDEIYGGGKYPMGS